MARARRNVIQDNTFTEQAQLLEPDAKRLDDLIDGAVWIISNHAESCPVIQGNLRVVFTDAFPDAPAMRIYFTITDRNNCTMHWIEYLDREDEALGM
jgi:hypothetical protein